MFFLSMNCFIFVALLIYKYMNQDNTKFSHPSQIESDYENLMSGFNNSFLFNTGSVLSHGKYVQLSAYEEKKIGEAVTTGSNSVVLTK